MHQDEIIKQLQEQNKQLKLENELLKARVSEIEPLKAKIRELEARLAQYENAHTPPSCPQEGKFGNNVIALATVLKYEDRLPHRKIHDAMVRLYI